MNISNGVNNFRKNLKEFLTSQNIIGTIASVTIAVSAGNMIRSFVNDIIFPTFYLLIKKKHTKKFKPISYELASIFGKEFITFLLVLVCTFYFIIKFMMVLFDIKPNSATSKATNSTNTISGDIASGNANISHTSS